MEKSLSLYGDAESLPVEQVRQQVNMIQNIMKSVMHRGVHFDTIKGCGDKPVLLKAGAEKLGFTFRLAPEFEIIQSDYDNGHREYKIICRLYTIPKHIFVASGVGVCSTLEKKYRYRWNNTGKPVPSEYWKTHDPEILGGTQFTYRKAWEDGKQSWFIFEQIEHPDPADYYNTCLKISKKRAHVDGIITATSASDIFTQDIEEMAETELVQQQEKKQANPPTEQKTTTDDVISDKQGKRLFAITTKAGVSIDDLKMLLTEEYSYTLGKDNVPSTKVIKRSDYEAICNEVENLGQTRANE